MGKIKTEKRFRGIFRDGGAFHHLEQLSAKLDSVEVKPANEESESIEESAAPKLSRGQRKRLAKKARFQSKGEIVSTAVMKEIKRQEGTLADFNELKSNLPDQPMDPKRNKPKVQSIKMTRNNRQRIAKAEIAQFQAVLSHPAFQANPMKTIQSHLENSIKAAAKK